MENNNILVEPLTQEVFRVRKKIELGREPLAIELGFPKLLIEIEKILASKTLDKQRLEKCAFGIFRLVTESYVFEQSELGQELLNLRTKIRDFTHNLR